ncbi:hypothetical protein B0H12DRAFT_1138723, partial [Mycena haematopus]
CPQAEVDALSAYFPDLTDGRGWMNIIYLSCMIILFPAMDHRRYVGEGTPEDELNEAEATVAAYSVWRKWLASKYTCFKSFDRGHVLDWEADVFTPCLLHLATTLYQYHHRHSDKNRDVEVFRHFTSKAFASSLSRALGGYSDIVLKQFRSNIQPSKPWNDTNFFKLDGSELCVVLQ